MIDTRLLNEIISDSGVTKTWLANRIGCSRPRVYRILDGTEDVTVSEIEAISKALRLTDSTRTKIFFAKKVE